VDCAKARRKIEAAAREWPGLARHRESCAACRRLARRQETPGRLFRALGSPDAVTRLQLGLDTAVLVRLPCTGPMASPAALRLRPVLAGAAALVLAVAVALLALPPGDLTGTDPASGGQVARIETEQPETFQVMRKGDSFQVVFTENGDKVHQVAQSTDPRFLRARKTRVRGDHWVDPSPVLMVGQVVFYRID
jgi:hypothetical protein